MNHNSLGLPGGVLMKSEIEAKIECREIIGEADLLLRVIPPLN